MLKSERHIGALVKTTLLDFPGKVACALFVHGCNLRCPYCQNRDLVIGTFADYEAVSFNQVVAHLEKRQELINGFVISGGEPFISPFLQPLIQQARDFGYAVKIDTNGMFPAKLHNLLQDCPPDFIALDVKTAPERYGELFAHPPSDTATKKTAANLIASIELLSKMPTVCREFRTVLVPNLVDEAEIRTIARYLPPDASWQFARFSNKNCLSQAYRTLSPYTEQKINDLVALAKSLIPNSQLR